MNKTHMVSMKITEADKNLILKAVALSGLQLSGFCRMSALEKARRTLDENISYLKNSEASQGQ